MGTRYNIVVTATDAATARVKAIKKSLSGIVSPISDVGKSVKALGKEVGIDRLAKGVATLGSNALSAVKSIGGISPALAGVVGLGGVGAIAAYAKQLIYTQSATLRFSAITGVAAQRVQVMEGAARLAGLSAEDMDGAIQNLGTTLQDAKWGRNQGALLMMNRLGIQLKTTKTGAIDTEAAIGDLADAFTKGPLKNAPVQTKAIIADQFGVGALLPILLKGRKSWEDYEAAAAKYKSPLTPEDLKKADEYRQKIDALSLSFENLGNVLERSAGVTLGHWADYWSDRLNKTAQGMRSRGVVVQMARNAVDNLGLGTLIGKGEGDYNSVNTGKRGGYQAAHRNLEERSITQVMAAQRAGEFSAAGKYQMQPTTLRDAVKALHLDPSQNFDAAMQDKIFNQYLLRIKRPEIGAYLDGKSNDLHAALKGASKEFASVADPDTGRSHYDGDGVNRASVTSQEVAKALMSARNAVQFAPAGSGLSDVWANSPAAKPGAGESTLHIKISGLPAGTDAKVTDARGPVKTTLKQETSMPDYNL